MPDVSTLSPAEKAKIIERAASIAARRLEGLVVLKGVCLKLGSKWELSACFDPMTLTYRAVWQGGFVEFDPYRWGTSRNATLDGTPWFTVREAEMPEGGEYLGYSRYGKRVVFHYRLGKTEIEDEPGADADGFYRRLDIKTAEKTLRLSVLPDTNFGLVAEVVTKRKVSSATIDQSGTLVIKNAKRGARVIVRIIREGTKPSAKGVLRQLNRKRRLELRWTETIRMPGTLGKAASDSSYVVDTLHVLYENPYGTVMQLTGIGILANGDALVCTLSGDIWLVSGIDDNLRNVTWRRFATGFNQPVGIHIDKDGIFVLDRGQIYRLHDRNGDGEADFYENYANDFGGYNRSHTHTFGLHRTADGSFHFTQRESILCTKPNRQTVQQGWGVRNCMSIGGSDDYFWVAPQEGTWTPASAIIEVNNGEFYGQPKKTGDGSTNGSGTIAAPLCFIPRGVDNSTGGMLEITSDKWGPFQGNHIGLSYGSGLHYLILRDAQGARPQGAVVPLPGEFLSGSMRGAFHPQDGQLYLVGMDG